MPEVVILSYARTPIGRFQGGLSSFRAPQLGAFAISAAVERAGIDPGAVDEVIMGNVLQAGVGQNPARQAAIYAGLRELIPEFSGSGLDTDAKVIQLKPGASRDS